MFANTNMLQLFNLPKSGSLNTVIVKLQWFAMSSVGQCVGPTRVGDRCSHSGLFVNYTVFRKNTHSHFLSYLHELFVDLNKNCSEYTQGLIDSDNVKIRYSLRSMTYL